MSLRINTPESVTHQQERSARKRRSSRRYRGDYNEHIPGLQELHDGDVEHVSSPDGYMAKLVKLVPAEAIALYPFLHAGALAVVQNENGDISGLWLPALVGWLVLAVVILLRWLATLGPDGKAQWGAVAIAAISFVLWVPNLGKSCVTLDPEDAGACAKRPVYERTSSDVQFPRDGALLNPAQAQVGLPNGFIRAQVTTEFPTAVPSQPQAQPEAVIFIPANFGVFHFVDPGAAKYKYELRDYIATLLLALWTILIPAFYRPRR
ncbi:MAG: hypothetical protein RIC14_03405 [Filomicrobium sp.]